MSLTDQSVTQMPAENITELTFITTPVTVNENGEVVQQAYVQHVATSEQENIDPQSQVLMLQPLTMGGGAEQNNMGMVSGTQFQIIDQSVLDSLQMAAVQENQVLQLSQDALQQVHILSQQDTPQDVTTIQLSDLTPQQQQMILQQVQQAQQQQPLQEHQLNTQESGMELIPIQTFQGEQLSPEPPPFKAPPTPVRPRGRPPKGDTIKPPVGKGPFKCEVCDKVFPKWGAYQRHVKGHEDDKPFRCIKCPETFNVEGNLRLHLAIHDTESPQCPECNKKFSRIASLKAHIMLHEKEENLVCNECGDEFSIQNQLDRHMAEHRQESEESKSYPCRQCTMEFGRLSQLREHMKQHYKIKNSLSHRHYKRNVDRSHFSHKCNSCDKTFQKPSQLQRHLRIHTGERPYKCDICDKAFNQKGALQIHMTKHTGERPYTCEFCQAKFAQRGNLRAHIQRVHNHTQSGDSPTFHCEECTCVFRKLGSLNAHMSRAHSDTQSFQVLTLDDDPLISEVHKHSGEDQKVVLQQLLELSEHVKKNQTSIIKIPEQQLGSDILQQALEHTGLTTSDNMDDGSRQPQTPGGSTGAVTVSTATAADGTTTTTITTADGITTSGNIQSLHTATNHVESVNEAISVLADMKPPRGIITTMAIHDSATGTIKRHIIRKVNGVRWHQCVYCTKEFKKPSDLIRHIRIHTHEKPYKCTQCFRSFAVKSTLTAHLKTHSGVKEFKCQVCDKHFSTQGSLKVHLRLHTGLKPFDCPHCDKRFRTSGHRKTHLQSHFKHPSPKKARKMMRRLSKPEINLPDVPLQEPILITETGLIQQPPRSQIYPHQYLGEAASMDRPYKCPHCSRAFKKSSHLKQHERSHTGEKPYKCVTCLKAFVSSGVLKAHVRTHTGVKAYKCMICDTNFTTNGSLKRHMSTHSEMRPFMCPYCQKTFKTSVNCKKHMKTHMQELAMQAMQEVGYTQPAEIEVTVDTEVADTANDEDDDDVGVPTEVHTQLEVTSAGDLVQYQNTQLGQEHQAAALTLEQQELGQPMTLLSQQQGMQDALVTDVQLQNALNSQNVCHQVLEPSNALTVPLQPQALPQQSLLAQSLLQTSQAGLMASSQQQSLLSINPSQLSLQSQMIPGSLEMPQHLNLTHPNTSITTNQECISIQNILQTKEGELVSDDPKQLEALLQEEIHTAPDDVTIAAMTATTDTRSHSRKFHCQFCGKLFKKSSHMKQHERTHTGEKPYRCLQCNRSFVSSGVLKSHLKTHLGVKSHRCQICQSTFTTNGSLTRHMMIHSSLRPFKCPFCNETFRTTLLCRRHMKSHKEMYSMDDESDTRPYNTRRSRSSVIQISEEQTEELLKTRLDETMSVSERLLIESAAEKEKLSLTESQQLRDMALPNKCHFCAKSFKKPSDLVRHVRIHTGEKPFMCVTCGRSFTVKSTLDSHMKTHKPGDKRFRCHVCNACFSTKGSLKVHMRLHTGAKPFKCMMCPQRFRTSGHRKSHILQHSKPPHIKKRKAERLRATAEATTNIQVGLGGIEMDGSQILQGQSLVQVPGQVEGLMQNQVINIDQSMLQGMPLSLTFPDTLGQVNDNNFATQVLQGLEGVQLQLNPGSLGQGIQISGLDPSVFNQPVQIDASLLQQLQQQGSISLTINPQVINQAIQGVDPNQIQNVQLSQQGHVGLADVMNPNVVIQPGTIEQPQETHEVLQTVMKVEPDADLAQQQTVVMEAMGTVEATEPQTESVILQAALKAVEEDEEEEEEEEGEEDDDDGEEEEEAVHYVQVGEDGQLHQFTLSGDGEATATGVDATTLQLLSQQDDPERSYMCAICSKRFKRSGHLKEHMLTHTGESPARLKHKLHKCTECEKGFAKPSQLERHIRIHTGERPYLCEVCHKSFNQKNALQVHLKGKHSGEKPHQCPYCELAFTQKGNLKTHVKRAHHQEMVMSMNLPIVVINPDGVQDADEAAVGDPGVKEPEEPGAGATVNLDDVLPFEHVA